MKERFLRRTMIVLVSGVLVLFCSVGYAQNIDPYDGDSQYAYGENIGWLNFEPIEGPGVTVTDTEVAGFVWAENIGWVNLSPTNYGGVTNDGSGNLGGYAWGENVGWINFAPTGGGVTIDGEGNFDGWAWGENIGWIHFQNLSIPYKVQTAWISPQPPVEGDLNGDGCVDRADYYKYIIDADIRGPEPHDPAYDLNGDGKVNIADARYLVTLFTNPRGAPCDF